MRLPARRHVLAVPDRAEIPSDRDELPHRCPRQDHPAGELSVYRVEAEKLEALRPDIIVTEDHCEVCAVSLKDVEAALCAWGGRRVEIVSLTPDTLTDIWEDMAEIFHLELFPSRYEGKAWMHTLAEPRGR
jgi:hypothetical protein